MFASYESELIEVKKTLKGYVQTIPSAKGEDRLQQIDAANEALEQAQDLLDKMSYDDSMEDKVEGYKREIASIESMLKKSITKAQQNIERESLLGDVRMNDLDLTSQDHQQRYADSTATLESHSAIIQDSQRMTEDTIAITNEALVELDRQRGVMERSRDRLGGINSSLDRAGKIMKSMWRRMITNKLIMVLIILFLLASIGLIVYFAWFYKPSDDSS